MNKNDFEKIIEGIVDEGDIVSKDDLEIVEDNEALEVDEYNEDFTTIEQARKELLLFLTLIFLEFLKRMMRINSWKKMSIMILLLNL